MNRFVFQDLDLQKTIWREGDTPLVNGAGPILPPDQATGNDRRPHLLLWLGVFACVAVGAKLVAVLITSMFYAPLPPVSEDVVYQTPEVTLAVGAWLIICLLAILRAWRKRTNSNL
jgi:hypothetical protein